MRSTKLHLVLLTACLCVLPSCTVSEPTNPCSFTAPPAAVTPIAGSAATGGGRGSLLVEPAALGLTAGAPGKLRADSRDTSGNTSAGRPTFTSSDPSVATVDPDGNITTLKPGSSTITVTTETGVTRTVVVIVSSKTVGVPTVNPTSMTLNKLGPAPTPLTVTDGTGTPTFTSNDPNVVTVASDGTVTAVGDGNTVITVRTGTTTILVPIAVAVQAASGTPAGMPSGLTVKVVPGGMGLPVGDTKQIKATVRNSAKDVVSVLPSYASSNPEIATVDQNGLVTAVSIGKTTITVSVAGDARVVQVNVNKSGSADGFQVSPNELTITELDVSPTSITTKRNKGTVTYTSDKPAIVTVSNDGTLTAIANGTATISVSDGTTSEQVPITVDTTKDRRPYWDNRDHDKSDKPANGNNGNSDGDTTNKGNSNNDANQSDVQNNGGGNKASYITPGCN